MLEPRERGVDGDGCSVRQLQRALIVFYCTSCGLRGTSNWGRRSAVVVRSVDKAATDAHAAYALVDRRRRLRACDQLEFAQSLQRHVTFFAFFFFFFVV